MRHYEADRKKCTIEDYIDTMERELAKDPSAEVTDGTCTTLHHYLHLADLASPPSHRPEAVLRCRRLWRQPGEGARSHGFDRDERGARPLGGREHGKNKICSLFSILR